MNTSEATPAILEDLALEHIEVMTISASLTDLEVLDDPGTGRLETAPTSIGLALLKQDVSHAAKIKEYESDKKADQLRIAKLEGFLRLAASVIRDGDPTERAEVADRLDQILGESS